MCSSRSQVCDERFDGPGPEAQWQSNLEKGTFLIQNCHHCSHWQFPPVACCQHCGAATPELIPASGKATVYSSTTVRSRKGDYNVAIVELDEGPRMMSRIEDIEVDGVKIGMAVRASIRGNETPIVVFTPEEARP